MSEPSCRKCGGRMRPGIATEQTYTGTPDFPGDTHVSTMSPGGPGAVIDCMKCEACGWSVTKGSLAMSDDVDKAEAWDAISAKNAEIARLREHLAEAERQRDAARTEALEEAVVAVRAGRWKNRDWVPGSLWDKLRAEMERDIRALIKEGQT